MRRRHKGQFDYYNELGIPEDANRATIKKAYRSLAIRYHPDKNPGNSVAEARFKRVAEAYEILSDLIKRQDYDNHDHPAVKVMPKAGDRHTDGSKKQAPEPSPFVDWVKARENVDDIIFKNNPFTRYQR